MVRQMDEIFNYTDEIENSLSYTNIRIYKVDFFVSGKEQDDIAQVYGNWFNASDKEQLTTFSAVCFLYGRELSDMLRGNKVNVKTRAE